MSIVNITGLMLVSDKEKQAIEVIHDNSTITKVNTNEIHLCSEFDKNIIRAYFTLKKMLVLPFKRFKIYRVAEYKFPEQKK